MTTILGKLSTAIQQYPTGRFGIVGSVPVELHGHAWDTEQAAIDALLGIGYTKFQKADCSWYAAPVDETAPVVTATTEGMSESEIFAYYKRTAPIEDVKFALRLNPPADVRAGFVALLTALESKKGKATTETKREYRRLHDAWRRSQMTFAPSTRDIDAAWQIYYRNAKGDICVRNAKGQLQPVTAVSSKCVIKPWVGKTSREPKAIEAPTQAPQTGPQRVENDATTRTCRTCAQEQPIDQFTYGTGGPRRLCRTCHKAQQKAAAELRKALAA